MVAFNFILGLHASYFIYPYLSVTAVYNFDFDLTFYNWESLGPFLLTLINNLKVVTQQNPSANPPPQTPPNKRALGF